MEDALQLAVETTRMLLGDGSGCTQGRDSSGTVFDSVRDFWAEQLAKHEPVAVPAAPARLCWYSKAAAFWQDPARCAASEDGVLGGFGQGESLASVDNSLPPALCTT